MTSTVPRTQSKAVRKDESGMAMLMVLGVLAVAMVLLSHLSLVVSILSRESYQVSRKYSLRYTAESAAETAYWFHLHDRRLFSNRSLGQATDEDFRAEHEGFDTPWMLDGAAHAMDDGRTSVVLNSAENGIRAANLKALKENLDSSDDSALIEDINAFIATYDDYVDTDDLTKVNGYEHDDYAAEEYPTLPRNGAMQFKAELYWLPDWQEFLTEELTTIPPSGISYSFSSNKNSLFSASESSIMQKLDIDEESTQMQSIRDALAAWRTNRTPLEDSLDITLLTQLKANFNFTEAGVALIHADAYDSLKEIHGTYRVIREAKMNSKTIFADKAKNCLSIWERRWE